MHEITAFLAMLPLPALVKDKKGRILYLNAKAEKLWKIRTKDVLGKTLPEVLGLSERDVRANDFKVLHLNAAQVFLHLGSAPRSPLCMLEFPMVTAEGKRVLGAIVMQAE